MGPARILLPFSLGPCDTQRLCHGTHLPGWGRSPSLSVWLGLSLTKLYAVEWMPHIRVREEARGWEGRRKKGK